MHLGELELTLWYANIAAAALVLLRLYTQDLAAIYSAVFSYILADTLEQILELIFIRNRLWYGYVYSAGQTVKVAVGIGVVMQLYRLALTQQPALAHFGRRTLGYLFGIAALISGAAILLDDGIRKNRHPYLNGFQRFERSLDLMTLIVLILVSGFLLWFPVRVRRNVAVCIGGFVLYTFTRWAGLLLMAVWPESRRQFSALMLVLTCACLLGWVVALRRAGEDETTIMGHGWNATEAERLTLQLDSINSRLVRMVR